MIVLSKKATQNTVKLDTSKKESTYLQTGDELWLLWRYSKVDYSKSPDRKSRYLRCTEAQVVIKYDR